jgi:YegS/Rv2252/BmrU family lipid kinase
MSVVLVVNPSSGGGRTGKKLDQLNAMARAFLTPRWGEVRTVLTTQRGDGVQCAREAAEAGTNLVVAVGGDGTANEVVNGILASGQLGTAFSILPAGTGSDLVRSLQIPAEWPAAMRAISEGEPWDADVLDASFGQADGSTRSRFGINVIGVGMSGDVVRRVNESSKAWGGLVSFLSATLSAMVTWPAPWAQVSWRRPDGSTGEWEGRLMNAFLANGSFCGGGMCVAPSGRMDDGLMNLAIVPKASILRMVADTRRLYDGTLEVADGVLSDTATEVTVRAVGDAFPSDVDGEQPGGTPVTVRVRPGRLPVVAPARGPGGAVAR